MAQAHARRYLYSEKGGLRVQLIILRSSYQLCNYDMWAESFFILNLRNRLQSRQIVLLKSCNLHISISPTTLGKLSHSSIFCPREYPRVDCSQQKLKAVYEYSMCVMILLHFSVTKKCCRQACKSTSTNPQTRHTMTFTSHTKCNMYNRLAGSTLVYNNYCAIQR